MKCPQCGNENRDGVKFCENCGIPLARACAQCGEPLAPQAKFCGHCGALVSHLSSSLKSSGSRLAALQQSAPAALQQKIRAASSQLEGERKPVTILFTDIVGSTALAERFDPEEWSEIVSGAHACVTEAVYHYEGTVAQLLGDGVLAFFGAPVTHEDDPIRAVRAAMDIQNAMIEYSRSLAHKIEKLIMRIGIHTGLVVVGSVGNDLHMEYLAIGDTVNLAARLQSAAAPGTVLLSESTARLVKAAFDLKSLGELSVKGKTEPVRAFQVEGAKLGFSGVRALEAAAPLVGREPSVLAFRRALDALVEHGGQIVTIIGEAGIGKSRLAEECRRAATDTCKPGSSLFKGAPVSVSTRWLEGRSLSYGQTLAFWTIAQLLRADLGISENDPEIKLRLALAQRSDELFGERAAEILPFIAHLLETKLESEAAERIQSLSGEVLKKQTLRALGDYFARLGEIQPTVLVFEDLHWADPSTVEALDALLPLTERVPLMLVALFRPERDHACWKLKLRAETDFPHRYTEIALQPLSVDDSGRLLSELLNCTELPANLRQAITDRAEGNPFYLEELLRSLIEQGALLRENSHWRVASELANIHIPDTLQGVLLARIGRLEEDVRHTLQLAAVIGRSFLYRLLEEIASAESQLDGQLRSLQRADLIREKARRPDLEYIFKHALTQEAAYNSLLLKRRREFHRQVGEALERLYSDRKEELAAMMGHHFERAEVRDKAVRYLTVAADRARAQYSNAEAIALYRSAIEQVNQVLAQKSVPPDAVPIGDALEANKQVAQLREQAAGLRECLGEVLALTGCHDDARRIFQEALDFADAPLVKARLHRRMGMTWIPRRQPQDALAEYVNAETALGNEQETTDWKREWLELQNERMWAYYWPGDFQAMQATADKAGPVLVQYGTPLQRARFFRNLVLTAYRRERYRVSDETLAYAREAVAASEESGVQSEISFSTFILGFTHMWRREWDAAEKHLQDARQVAEHIQDAESRVLALTYLTMVYRARREMENFAEYLAVARHAAEDAKMLLYVAVAQMQDAWLSWRKGNFVEAQSQGYTALENLHQFPIPHPAEWFARLPLLATHLRLAQEAQAVDNARAMLAPPYVRFPPVLENALQEGVTAWEALDFATARTQLSRTVELAEQLGYL